MDKEQIIQWAREAAGLKCNCCTPYFEEDDIDGFEAFLEAFAKLVAAHERDRVIKAATKLAETTANELLAAERLAVAAMVKPLDESLADEILARGNNA
jgi:S-methylmethionine-dependent homocysteine/selenocysteine methylase